MNKRNYLRNLGVGAFCLMATLTGCKDQRTEYSRPMNAQGTIWSKEFVPAFDGTATGIALDNIALGVATSHPDQHYITFGNEFLEFKIDNKSDYNQFEVGDDINIIYREIYLATYGKKDGSEEKSRLEKEITGYEFISLR